MAKPTLVRVEILELHDDNCSGALPDRCRRLSVSGQMEYAAQGEYSEVVEMQVRDLVAGTMQKFEEAREAWDRGADH